MRNSLHGWTASWHPRRPPKWRQMSPPIRRFQGLPSSIARLALSWGASTRSPKRIFPSDCKRRLEPPSPGDGARLGPGGLSLRRPLPQWAGMAATLAIGVIVGTLVPRSEGADPVETRGGSLYAAAALSSALDNQLASAPSKSVRVGLTFRDQSTAICRSFTGAQASGLQSGTQTDGSCVGCSRRQRVRPAIIEWPRASTRIWPR